MLCVLVFILVKGFTLDFVSFKLAVGWFLKEMGVGGLGVKECGCCKSEEGRRGALSWGQKFDECILITVQAKVSFGSFDDFVAYKNTTSNK